MLDPYFKHMKRLRAGMGWRTACERDEVTSGTEELCGSFMCTGLNQQLHQERLSSFVVAQS